MGPLPFIIGALAVAGLAAAARKPKASSSSSSSSTKPTTTTTPTTPATPPASASLPLAIVEQIIASGDALIARQQAVWLNDSGYPKTSAALLAYLEGDIDIAELRRVAAAELQKPAATVAKAKGTTELDRYGSYLLSDGSNDELFEYALDSTSIPLVSQAAARLAASGDLRAAQLTQHLADLT